MSLSAIPARCFIVFPGIPQVVTNIHVSVLLSIYSYIYIIYIIYRKIISDKNKTELYLLRPRAHPWMKTWIIKTSWQVTWPDGDVFARQVPTDTCWLYNITVDLYRIILLYWHRNYQYRSMCVWVALTAWAYTYMYTYTYIHAPPVYPTRTYFSAQAVKMFHYKNISSFSSSYSRRFLNHIKS